MSLSTKTALEAWDRVQQDLGLSINSPAYPFRFSDQNEADRTVIGSVYDLVAPFYKTQVTLVPSTVGAYYVSGASWDVDLLRLTATMNRDFAASDVGCLVVFRDGNDIYLGTVNAFVSVTVVELAGDNLPAADIAALEYVLLSKTAPTSDIASLSSVDMARAGQEVSLNLFSSLTTSTSAVRTKEATIEEIKTFRASGNQNKNLILFSLSGNNLYLAKGSSLTSYGTLTLEYPGWPTRVTTDASVKDVPDGSIYELCILQWEKMLRRRLGMAEPELTKEIQTHIENAYTAFGRSLTFEARKEKIAKLI